MSNPALYQRMMMRTKCRRIRNWLNVHLLDHEGQLGPGIFLLVMVMSEDKQLRDSKLLIGLHL
jgi:hypothetical protein